MDTVKQGNGHRPSSIDPDATPLGRRVLDQLDRLIVACGALSSLSASLGLPIAMSTEFNRHSFDDRQRCRADSNDESHAEDLPRHTT